MDMRVERKNEELQNHCVRHRAPKPQEPNASDETTRSGNGDTAGERKKDTPFHSRKKTKKNPATIVGLYETQHSSEWDVRDDENSIIDRSCGEDHAAGMRKGANQGLQVTTRTRFLTRPRLEKLQDAIDLVTGQTS
jgi:hypothetical protein